jgi:hypothetical protein
MSRITGSDAFNMMEAYNNVYAPQELTEEQVWEEVENWVNSLVEEGYDLSEYSWEDMYEEYLNENQLFKDIQANAGRIGGAISSTVGAAGRTLSGINRALVNRVTPKRPMPGLPANAAQPGGPASNRVGSYTSRFDGARDDAFAKARQIQGSPVVGTGAPRPAAQAPARPAPAARPAAQVPARPATAPAGIPKPAPAPVPNLPGLSGTGALNAPARQSLAQQRVELQKLRLGSQMRQAGQNVVSTQLAHFDPFDVVLGHLIDEGYADTEESALQIMANMSEEWREDILDEGFKRMNRGKIEKQAQRLGGDKGDVLRSVAAKMDTEDERKYSTRQSRRNKAGGAGSEYRKGKELQARDDAKSDIEKYGFH